MCMSRVMRVSVVLGTMGILCDRVALGLVAGLSNEGDPAGRQALVAPGGSFSVDISLVSSEEIVSASMRLAASSSNLATIADGSYHAPWDVASSPVPLGPLTPISDYLYATVPTFGPQPVSSPLATLSLVIDPNAQPGIHTLTLVDIYYSTSRTATVLPSPGEPGGPFTICVVPEPASSILALVSAFVLSTGRRA
jgi:hypothetical protein